MKNLILLFIFVSSVCFGQTFDVQNLNVHGTANLGSSATITGGSVSGLTTPLPVASGGTGANTGSGTALDNISGFSGTGLIERTGAGTYAFLGLNSIPLSNLAQQAANTVLGNMTGSTANVTAFTMPSCNASGSALAYVPGTGFTCNTSITAATATSASTATTQAFGDNTTSIATDAFVQSARAQLLPAIGISTPTTLTAAQAGALISVSGTVTVTLPAASSVPGRTYYLQSATSLFSLVPSGSDTFLINGQTLSVLVFSYGDEIQVQANGSSWFVVHQYHQPCANINDYGGDPTNTLDNGPAWSKAIAANRTGEVCVYFPPGTYKFNASASYTNPSAPSGIMVKGAGQDVSTLNFVNGTNGITITSNAPGSGAHVRDLTVTTGVAGGGSSGIAFIQNSSLAEFASSDIYNVSLRGNDNNGTNPGSHYWSSGILIDGQDNVNVESVTTYGVSGSGVGLVCQGNGTQYSIYINISKSVFNSIGIGIEYLSYCQGMTITQSNFQNCTDGFVIPAGQAGVLSQLQISDSQFACTSNEIYIQTNVGNAMIHDNDIFVHTGVSGIFISNTAGGGSIHGNSINTDGSGSTGASGVVLGSGDQNFIIGNNQIAGLATCIWYQSGSSFNQNLGNNLACTTAVINSGSSNTTGTATN